MDQREQTVLYKGHGTGGTRWWFILLAKLLKTERWGGMSLGEDDSVEVTCQCSQAFMVHSEQIVWCPKCHHGYVTEFRTFRVPRWMYSLRRKARIKPDQKVVTTLREYYEKQHYTSEIAHMQALQDEIDGK